MMFNRRLLVLILVGGVIGVTVASGLFFGWWEAAIFEVISRKQNQGQNQASPGIDENLLLADKNFPDVGQDVSPFSGTTCETPKRRPLAVILAGDRVVRPLSGLSEADLVMETPVLTGGVTRYIAIYVCGNPPKIGSLRSARHDFIPLAMGMDAILVHWGGSHYALDRLNAGVMDNINALYNPFSAFWRIPGIPMPHNGFTSLQRLISAAEKLGYRLDSEFEGYPHLENPKSEIRNPKQTQNPKSKIQNLTIGYPYPYNVKYEYDPETNSYYRWRGGIKQIDKNNNEQLTAKVIVVMQVSSYQLERDYNDLDIEGSGSLEVYQNGEVIIGQWKKDGRSRSSKLYFLDEGGKEIEFAPGQVWIQIVEPYQKVEWEIKT